MRGSPADQRIELYGANVKEKDVEIARHLSDDLRLADAARAPDVQGHTFTDQRMKRLVELRCFIRIYLRRNAGLVVKKGWSAVYSGMRWIPVLAVLGRNSCAI